MTCRCSRLGMIVDNYTRGKLGRNSLPLPQNQTKWAMTLQLSSDGDRLNYINKRRLTRYAKINHHEVNEVSTS